MEIIDETVTVQQENHIDQLIKALKYFACTGVITDISFVSGCETFHVHHIILSCFSNYFENLKKGENIKCFVYMDQMKFLLEALIDYIYTGVACIPQMHKKQLAEMAASLHIMDFMSRTDEDSGITTVVCPNHKFKLFHKIWNSHYNPSKSDVMFVTSNKEKVFAHACILSACSPFLLKVFTKHGVDQRKPYVIALNNVQKAHLELVLEFCYKGEICFSFHDIQSVYNVADLLGMDMLCKLLQTKLLATSALAVPLQAKEKDSTNIIRTATAPTALTDLLHCERLVDVFIFTDGKVFKAHSVILSVYCVFFKKLANYLDYNFKDIIILIKDFKTKHMEALLNYVYTGEAMFEGSAEEFCEIMSEWLDLNALPVSSSNIMQSIPPPVQTFTEDCESVLSSAIRDDTVEICKKKLGDVETEGSKNAEENFKSMHKNEIFEKNKKKEALQIKEELRDNKVQVFKGKVNTIVETHIGKSVNNIPSVPGHTIVRMKNVCDVFGRDTDTGISKFRSRAHEVVNKRNYIVDDSKTFQNTGREMRKGSKDLRKCGISESLGINLEDSSKNKKSETYGHTLVKQNIKGHKRIVYNTVGIHTSETEESEIDEPEMNMIKAVMRKKGDKLKDEVAGTIAKGRQRIFECQTCNQKFVTRWEYKIHLSEHPAGDILQCKDCQKIFNKPSEMQNHLRTHTGVKPLQCDVCGMSFTGKNTLKKHEHIHSVNKEFECEVCNKTFSRKQYLQEHKRTHTGNKPYVCDVCHKSFVGKTGLNHHKKTHKSADEKKSAVCEICGKSFTRHALWTHMKHHNKEHKCEYCNKCFATTAALHTHVAGAHLGHSWHHCGTCNKGFIRKAHLSRHMKTHEKESNVRSFACNECPSKFKSEVHLKAHTKRKHTEQSSKSQKCGICSKHFPTQSTLLYHQRLHFLERPHRCNLCGKSFAMPYQLRDHTRLHHSEEKLFSCSVCKKKCATQSLLNRHLLTHRPTFTTKSKPPGSFSCSSCNKIFHTKLALSNHSRTHNFSRPYQCNVCRKAFRYQDSLLKHLRLHPSDPNLEETVTKELPCIYTIQVCRPSLNPINTEAISNQNYANEQATKHILGGSTVAEQVSITTGVNASGKTDNDIALLQLKPVEESYLRHSILQTEDVRYTSLPTIDSSSVCNISVAKSPDLATIPQRPYSITIDGNLCCNSAISTDGEITPSITLLPERSDMEISEVNVGVTMPSHVLLPVTPNGMVELSQMSVPLPSEELTHEFHTTLTKEFSL